MGTGPASSFYLIFFLQLSLVAAVSMISRRGVPARLNILLSSAFVTTPLWCYAPLADVGMVFLFDLVVPLILLRAVLIRFYWVPGKEAALIAILVFLIPVFYAPIGFFFLAPAYTAYHSVILGVVLYRALLIALAVMALTHDLRYVDKHAVARLMALQCLVLFAFGALQYLGGVDLVVYERIKDVEHAVDQMLSGEQKILFGFGFLGLFRGAVPQMAIIGVFWWLAANVRKVDGKGLRYALIGMCLLGTVCVVGSLSRIGILAIGCVLVYTAYVNNLLRLWAVLLVFGVSGLLLFGSVTDSIQVEGISVILDRFDPEQFTGEGGSGVTRIQAAGKLLTAAQTSWQPWVTGLGGFNPIGTEERYGVFGMHGDYLDAVGRYGVVVGLIYIALVTWLFLRQLGGLLSGDAEIRRIARAFGVLAIGISILALTQGSLLFAGSAGYLAAVQAWLAIAFCVAVRRYSRAPSA